MIPIQAITDKRLSATDVRVFLFLDSYGWMTYQKIGEALGIAKSTVFLSIRNLKTTGYMFDPSNKSFDPSNKSFDPSNKSFDPSNKSFDPSNKPVTVYNKAFKKLIYINKDNAGVRPIEQKIGEVGTTGEFCGNTTKVISGLNGDNVELNRRRARMATMRVEGKAEEEIERYLRVAQRQYPVEGGENLIRETGEIQKVDGRERNEA